MSAILLSCAFVLGILLGCTVKLPPGAIIAGLTPLPVLWLVSRRRKHVILLGLGYLVFVGGALHSTFFSRGQDQSLLRDFGGPGAVNIEGTVCRDPEIGPDSTRLYLSVLAAGRGGEWSHASGRVLLFAPAYADYGYGDLLIARGKLETGTSAHTGQPNYGDFLARQGACASMSYPGIEIIERGRGSPFKTWIYHVRSRMSDTLARVLPEPQASLAQGITLGLRANIPGELKDDFSRTGTTHLLAISGVNLTIVAGMLATIAVWLFGRRYHIHIWVTLAIVWFYATLTGLQPPVLRAAVMFSFFLAADAFGRQRRDVIALVVSAALIVGFSPSALLDLSFQLSVLAMAGLVFICPTLQSWGRKLVEPVAGKQARRALEFVADGLAVNIGAMAATWPLVAYHFGVFSWVGLPATFLTLPAMPAIIVTGMLSGGLGLAFLPIGQAAAWAGWLPTSYLLLVVKASAAVPASYLDTGSFSPALVVAYYGAFGLAVALWRLRAWLPGILTRVRTIISGVPWRYVAGALAAMAALVWLTAFAMPDDRLHISVLNVGQGEAILIERGHQQILVDGGPDRQASLLELGKRMPFWDRTIEALILTHPHSDHLTGLVEVLKRYRVNYVVTADVTNGSPLLSEWERLLEEKSVRRVAPAAGEGINLGDEVTVAILSDGSDIPSDAESGSDNGGLVLRVTFGKVSFLLTADTSREGEAAMAARRAGLASTVLKVAHHGSGTSTSRQFLAAVNPRVAVISVGADNGYGFPNDAVISILRDYVGPDNTYRTDEDGTVEFVTDGNRLWVTANRRR